MELEFTEEECDLLVSMFDSVIETCLNTSEDGNDDLTLKRVSKLKEKVMLYAFFKYETS